MPVKLSCKNRTKQASPLVLFRLNQTSVTSDSGHFAHKTTMMPDFELMNSSETATLAILLKKGTKKEKRAGLAV